MHYGANPHVPELHTGAGPNGQGQSRGPLSFLEKSALYCDKAFMLIVAFGQLVHPMVQRFPSVTLVQSASFVHV